MSTPKSAAAWGSTPIMTNSVVPMPKAPMASASSATGTALPFETGKGLLDDLQFGLWIFKRAGSRADPFGPTARHLTRSKAPLARAPRPAPGGGAYLPPPTDRDVRSGAAADHPPRTGGSGSR